MTAPQQDRGFTLVELITVLAVLTVVSTLGTMAYLQIDGRWRSVHKRTELHAAADAIFAQMRGDFANLLAPRRTGLALSGETATYRDEDIGGYWQVAFDDDRLILPVELFNSAEGVAERRRVMYRIDREPPLPVLVRSEGPLDAAVPAGAAMALPPGRAPGVLAMAIEYLQDGEWGRTWDRAGAPDAVRVSLTLRDRNRPDEQIARRAVFAVQVD